MKCGNIEIPEWRVDALAAGLVPAFLEDMRSNPEVRDRVLAKAEEIRAEREAREASA